MSNDFVTKKMSPKARYYETKLVFTQRRVRTRTDFYLYVSQFSEVLWMFLSSEGSGCLAEDRGRFTFLIAVNTVPSRSSRYTCYRGQRIVA